MEGRLAQRLKYRGTTIYPETIFNVLQEIRGVSACYVEVRLAADGSDEVTVFVAADKELGEDSLEESLQARLRVRPVVRVRAVEDVTAVMSAGGGRKLKKFFDYR